MRSGIIFGTDELLQNFAVVGDDCEGNISCRWMSVEEVEFELRVEGIDKIKTYDKELVFPVSSSDSLFDSVNMCALKLLPVVDKNISYKTTMLKEDAGVFMMSVEIGMTVIKNTYLSDVFEGGRGKSFCVDVVMDYMEDFEDEPYWKDISDCSEVYKHLSPDGTLVFDESYNNLKKFVDKFNITHWAGFVASTPIMALLKNKNIHACRNNYFNGLSFYKKYGVEESPVFRYPLMDHVIVFKDSDNNVLLVSNPYLSDAEITQYMDCLVSVSGVSGDYTGLKYSILGKNSHIYRNSDTNVVVFSL